MKSKDIAICLTAFERPESCQRAINSVRDFYPDVPIYVGDDSRWPPKYEDAFNYHYKFDTGLSEKRNDLIRETTEPYVFIMEDDMKFTHDGFLETLHEILSGSDIEICAPEVEMINDRGRLTFPHYNMKIQDNALIYTQNNLDFEYIGNHVVCRADFVPNAFMAKRKVFDQLQWDPKKKLGEHPDFFLRTKRLNVKIASTTDARIEHHQVKESTFYRLMRKRGEAEFFDLTAEEWNFNEIRVQHNGGWHTRTIN
jgi:hypothetical protein